MKNDWASKNGSQEFEVNNCFFKNCPDPAQKRKKTIEGLL